MMPAIGEKLTVIGIEEECDGEHGMQAYVMEADDGTVYTIPVFGWRTESTATAIIARSKRLTELQQAQDTLVEAQRTYARTLALMDKAANANARIDIMSKTADMMIGLMRSRKNVN